MKNRGFAHTTIAGVIDITSRAYYRQQLAEVDEALDKKELQLDAQNNSIKEAAKAYNGAKMRLQRFERRKGSNGRFVKRNEPAEE